MVHLFMQIAFTRQKDFGKEQRELQWAHAQRTLHGLQPPDTKMFTERTHFTELNQMAEEAKRRAEIARWETVLSGLSQFDTNLDKDFLSKFWINPSAEQSFLL